MAKCYHEFVDPNSCNCLDLSCFGFEDFCIECYKITIDILFKVLNQIENVKISANALVIDDQLTIKCCKWYEFYWKKIKSSPPNDFKFDESIEKNKSIRKFIILENVLFHSCFPCLKEVLMKKQICCR